MIDDIEGITKGHGSPKCRDVSANAEVSCSIQDVQREEHIVLRTSSSSSLITFHTKRQHKNELVDTAIIRALTTWNLFLHNGGFDGATSWEINTATRYDEAIAPESAYAEACDKDATVLDMDG